MSIAKVPANIAGETTSAANTTAVYSALSVASTLLNSTNTQTEWVSSEHITTTEQVFSSDMKTFFNANDQFVLNSETYTLISLAATPFRVSYTPDLTFSNGGERLRCHADINVDAVGQINLPNLLMSEQDCFYLQLWYRDGNGVEFPFSQEWGYSLTNYTDTDITVQGAYVTGAQNKALEHPRKRFKCSITGFLSPIAAGIDRIEVRARLDNLATIASVTFEEAVLTTILVRN